MHSYDVTVYDYHRYKVLISDLTIIETLMTNVDNYTKIYNTDLDNLIIYKSWCPKIEVENHNEMVMSDDCIHKIWNANLDIINLNTIENEGFYSIRNFNLEITNRNQIINNIYRKFNMNLEVKQKLKIILDMTIAQYKRLAVFDSLRLCDLDPLTLEELDIVVGSLKS